MRTEISFQSLPEQIFANIKMMILSGEYKGGERIPEVKIAQEFGVSRTPIREALRRLEEYGLITIKPRRYAQVLRIGAKEVEDITLLRIQLESLSVRLFIDNATDIDRQAVKSLAEECKTLFAEGDTGGFYEKDSAFHLEIAKRSGNTYLYGLLEKLDAKVQLSRLVKGPSADDMNASLSEHDLIVHAISRSNAEEAVQYMEAHIKNNM